MNASDYAPDFIRARYLRALRALPFPAPPIDLVDPRHLTILGAATVDGRAIVFGTTALSPRLWVAFNETDPTLLGYLTGLVVGEPDLWVCDRTLQSWALQGNRTAKIKEAATRVWAECLHTCEG